MNDRIKIRHLPLALLALGVSVCLVGAFLMVTGDSILGVDHTGIATIVGMVGLGTIVRARRMVP
jgi:hypothetical protein